MSWLQRLFNRRKMEEQLEKEMRFHLEQHTRDLIARGCTPGEARRQAHIAFGGSERMKEDCRDARGTRWLEDLVQDVRYAVRTLCQRPGFAAIALLTLALGTGATTVMFTVINGVLLKPLPYAEPDRLLLVQEKTDWSTQWGDLWAFTYPNYLDCKRDNHSLDMAGFRFAGGTVTASGHSEYVDSFEVSAGLFPVLGIPLARGRNFLPEEDRQGAAPVAIIGYGLWQRFFGGSDAAIGSPLTFEGKPYTVVGIAPARFRLSDSEADVFTPLGQGSPTFLENRERHGVRVWARLHSDATLSQARAELDLTGHHLAEQYPKSNKGRTFIADPLKPDVDDVRSTLWLLLGAVTVVLLIACVNVASLLLARAVSRGRELAIRVALGAGRSRVVRQCLTESAVLALSGGVLGILLAALGIRPFVVFWPGALPRAEEVHLDWRVLVFTLGVSLLCGLLFGLAPAFRVPRRELEQTLRTSARTVAGSSRRLHSAFVISEIALAVVLLVSAGMLGRTLLRISALNPGVNVHNVMVSRMALTPATLANPDATRAAWQQVLESARSVPGVQSVAIVDTVPMREGNNQIGYRTSAAPVPDDKQPLVLATSVTPEYLQVVGLPLRAGRFFTDQDRIGSQSVVVIDEVMAQQAFPGQEPIGKQLWIDLNGDPTTVVGVVGHVRYWGLAGDDQAKVRAQLYYPFAQVPDRYMRRWSELMSVAVRTNLDPLAMVEPLKRAVRGVTGDQVLYEVRTLEQLAKSTIARQRFLMLLFGLFAGLALLLACVGVYGVLAYLTNQRVPEIGVRMALGASADGIMRMVLKQSLKMILIGITAGAVGALLAARVLKQTVEGVERTEPLTWLLMVGVLIVAALIASILPARRASRVDPMTALRQE